MPVDQTEQEMTHRNFIKKLQIGKSYNCDLYVWSDSFQLSSSIQMLNIGVVFSQKIAIFHYIPLQEILYAIYKS